MTIEATPVERAGQLLTGGNRDAARSLLERASEAGDAAAAFALGKSFLGGREFGRDLDRSRHYFGMAARLGDESARSAYIALLANGTGGNIDWQGAIDLLRAHAGTNPDYARQLELVEQMQLDECGSPSQPAKANAQWPSPKASIFRNFLSPDECAYLVHSSARFLKPSTVVDPRSGQLISDPVRTSDYAAFPLALENPVVRAINLRIAAASATLPSQGEPLQVLRYQPGQEYKLHYDALPNSENQRVFTFLIYLNDDFEGGSTVFPNAGRKFRGKMGDAILFANVTENGEIEAQALHAGDPVTSGTKYLASRWIRCQPIDLSL